jgi:hypothetical protein
VGWSLRQPRAPLTNAGTLGNLHVQPGDPHDELPPALPPAHLGRQVHGEMNPRVWLNDYRLACQLGGATTDVVIIRNLPLHHTDSAEHGSSTCRPAISTAGTTWSACSWGTSRTHTCALGTPGTCGHAPRSPTNRSGTSPSVVPSSRVWLMLTQNLHLTPSTQQAEQVSFTREKIPRRASQFS